MSHELLSVDQVAERLGLQVRTVRAYIRDGRLNALKIGKQYRITRADLEAFLGPAAKAMEARPRLSEVASIVELERVDREAAIRIGNLLIATANGRPREGDDLRVETIYDEGRERLKVIVVGGLGVTAELFKLLEVWRA
jgi:excisionase family DNA binding protein